MEVRKKRVIVSVISDLVTDQRVHRTSISLSRMGFQVTLIGREKKDSASVSPREYATHRFRLWWESGPLFYAVYNIRLFFYLLFNRADILVSNDLDTLPANFLAAKLKGSKLFYDSHEYFTGVPELVNRPRVQRIWKKIEKIIFPKLENIYTVNESIAQLYEKEYGKKVNVVRNVPLSRSKTVISKTRAELGLPEDKKILLFQGAGINIDRGAEEALEAMLYTNNMVLLFIGGGDVIDLIRKKSIALNLDSSVFFIPKLPMDELIKYSSVADAGLTLDKDTNINYRFSLPNKLFDYIHAGLPVLASDLPEVSSIVKKYNIGLISTSHDPKVLAACMTEMFNNQERLDLWKENLKLAASELCWEKEEKKLLELFKDAI